MQKMLKFALAALAVPFAAAAFPTTGEAAAIKAASCFPKGSFFSRRFEAIVEDMKAAGLEINYVGGAPAIGSPFTLVQKMTLGAYDMVNCTGAYYGNVLPEADALKMQEITPAEARENGAFDYISKLHREKNMEYIARIHSGERFHLYLAPEKAIDKPDLTGLHLRVAPIYRAFFEALGATTQRSNLAQIYTYMENGTVAGYGWPITGMLPDWHKVTGYRVDPGFYDADIHILFNSDAYAKLSDDQKAAISKLAVEWENKGSDMAKADTEKAHKDQDAKGIKPITFSDADTVKWEDAARDAGWASIVEASPEHGPKLRELLSK